jgi:hypothetical protein
MSRETAGALVCLFLFAVWVLSVIIDESGDSK